MASAPAGPAGVDGMSARVGREAGGSCVRHAGCLSPSDPGDVAVFLADLRTFRDRAITLAMLLGGQRAAEVSATPIPGQPRTSTGINSGLSCGLLLPC